MRNPTLDSFPSTDTFQCPYCEENDAIRYQDPVLIPRKSECQVLVRCLKCARAWVEVYKFNSVIYEDK